MGRLFADRGQGLGLLGLLGLGLPRGRVDVVLVGFCCGTQKIGFGWLQREVARTGFQRAHIV